MRVVRVHGASPRERKEPYCPQTGRVRMTRLLQHSSQCSLWGSHLSVRDQGKGMQSVTRITHMHALFRLSLKAEPAASYILLVFLGSLTLC
jgi:hypothetical protein